MLEHRLKARAHALGFDLVGIASAQQPETYSHFRDWLTNDFAGEMSYLHKQAEARSHPTSILSEVRSVVMVALSYAPAKGDQTATAAPGRVARYAQGADYHDVLRARLNALLTWVQEEIPGCHGRGVVDTAPLLERDFARLAGLGWFGKNTMLLHPRLGSFFLLGALLLDRDLAPDPPFSTSHCGTCTACLDACPTEAFVAPGVLDSRRCLSYLTIELKSDIPDEFKDKMTEWLFGCDVCQDVCPWNRKAPPGTDRDLQPLPHLTSVDLLELLSLTEEEFRRRFRDTALWRSRRRGLFRNAALILGNRGDATALPVLRKLRQDPEPVIREAVHWAVEQIETRIGASRVI